RSGGAAACPPLEQILLVIFLGLPEGLRGDDLGDDRRAEAARALEAFLRRARRLFLLGRVEEDRAPVLGADVGSLPIGRGGVVAAPEDAEKIVVAHAVRIEEHLHRLRVSGGIGADLLVGGVFLVPAGVAHPGGDHPGDATEALLHAPEAARREGRTLDRHRLSSPPFHDSVRGPSPRRRALRYGARPWNRGCGPSGWPPTPSASSSSSGGFAPSWGGAGTGSTSRRNPFPPEHSARDSGSRPARPPWRSASWSGGAWCGGCGGRAIGATTSRPRPTSGRWSPACTGSGSSSRSRRRSPCSPAPPSSSSCGRSWAG